jgi:putative transposase
MLSVNRKIKYRLYPTAKQARVLHQHLKRHQRLYNAALHHRRMNYDLLGNSINLSEQCRALTRLRAARPEYAKLNAQSCQVTLRGMDLAFRGLFRRRQAGARRAGYPRFKSLDRYHSWGHKKHGQGWRLVTNKTMRHGRLRFSGIGVIQLRGGARTPGTPKTCEIVHKVGRWYASITIACRPVRMCGSKAAGLDWGTETFLTIAEADGTTLQIPNPRLGRRMAQNLPTAQRQLSKKQRRSKNRQKATRRLGRLHHHLANRRKDFLHQTTNGLIQHYGLIATEALNVTHLTAAGGRRKQELNREILSTAPGTVFRILACKTEEAGSWYVAFSPRQLKPSQTCYACGRQEKKPLSIREHVCPCGVRCGRDENAARVLVHWALIGNAPGSERTRCGEPSAGLDHTIETQLSSEKQESPAKVS